VRSAGVASRPWASGAFPRSFSFADVLAKEGHEGRTITKNGVLSKSVDRTEEGGLSCTRQLLII